ncbi:MAG: hypothetical protein F7C34_00540, partial [Desulfurococcales archaeon]|nr:hypothetical protein [Desulfurococcales archaeon]
AILSYPCGGKPAIITVRLVFPRGPAATGGISVLDATAQAEVCVQAEGGCTDYPLILAELIKGLRSRGLGVSLLGPCRA